jgi:hypothetical protein
MFDILSIVPGRKKLTASGWHSFNAICCHQRGHKADRRQRGGIKLTEHDSWTYHCFNCGFSCGFENGKTISKKSRELLAWCGVDDQQIQRWNLESLQNKDLLDYTRKFKKEKPLQLKPKKLPDCELLEDKPEHKVYIDYLLSRNVSLDDFNFYVTPDETGRNSNRIIIPYTYKGENVGHTSRFLDNRIPKYINDQQPGYVFGYDQQSPEWQVCILTEGIFDALSINGCALTHNTISEEQARMLRQLNRKIIVVPDRDKTGLEIIDRAIELGYSISLPDWENDIKDVNDAVIRYGKVPTLLSILQSATNSKIKIEMRRKQIAKGI